MKATLVLGLLASLVLGEASAVQILGGAFVFVFLITGVA